MTYEEALKHFKSLQKRYTREHNGKMCEKVALAIEALEKQIPKKPAKQWGNYVCPNCRTDTQCRTVMGWEKHCPDCGQALLWEDIERHMKILSGL